MEMGLMIATFVMSALSALCSVAALTILLVTAPKEEKPPSVTADAVPPPLTRGGERRCKI